MEKNIACCGLNCEVCPAYISMKNNDDELRMETAKTWSEMFKTDIKPEDVNCSGCNSNDTVLFSHCSECKIRDCSHEKGYDNCAYCGEMNTCDKIQEFFSWVPESKETLTNIKRSLK